jgi:hypothetical protein
VYSGLSFMLNGACIWFSILCTCLPSGTFHLCLVSGSVAYYTLFVSLHSIEWRFSVVVHVLLECMRPW